LSIEPKVPAGLRVLVAEDEPLIALDAESILQSLGVGEVVCVHTLSDGLNAAAATKFSAGLLDLRLGQESSIPLAQLLAAQKVPFGFLTGYQADAIPPDLKDVPFVAKPFTPLQLADLVMRLIGQV
jgi:DNA-binding LytR/AlgR family response regulator